MLCLFQLLTEQGQIHLINCFMVLLNIPLSVIIIMTIVGYLLHHIVYVH